MLLCEFVRQDPSSDLVVLSLDMEKAYDRVNRQYLLQTLLAYGFPNQVIDFLHNYYARPVIQYKVNNYLTNLVHLKVGVLQGDPLACNLFLISLQLLLDILQENKIQTQFYLPHTGCSVLIPSLAYADNLVVPVADIEFFTEFTSAITDHELASHAQISEPKSSAFFLGTRGRQSGPEHWHTLIPYSTTSNNQERVELSCPFRPNGDIPIEYLNHLLVSIKIAAAQWHQSDLYKQGHVIVTNTYVLSRLSHTIQLCPLPPDFHLRIAETLIMLTFRSSRTAIPFGEVSLPQNQGGLGLINPKHMATTMNTRCIV